MSETQKRPNTLEALGRLAPRNDSRDLRLGRVIAIAGDAVLVAIGDAALELCEVTASAVRVAECDVGRAVVLQPVVNPAGASSAPMWFLLGLLADAPTDAAPAAVDAADPLHVTLHRDLVFECGKATISLSRSGLVRVEGECIITDAAGVNRIRGGSVEIN
jgi:hypothetical protein